MRITNVGLLFDKLWDSNDPDCKEAEENGFKDAIKDLFESCYEGDDFIGWLDRNNWNPANNFSDAEFVHKEDCSDEEWEEYKEDCLFINETEEIICLRW